MIRPSLPVALALLVALSSCSPTFRRGQDDPSINEAALSTGLDAADLDRALADWYDDFAKSPRILALPEEGRILAVLQINNDTSQYIAPQLDALISGFETRLVNDGFFRVVARDQLANNAILQERMHSTSDSVDPQTSVALGKEFGVHYVVYGKVSDNVEKTSDTKRVQYFLTLKVTAVETSETLYQQKVQITKQVED